METAALPGGGTFKGEVIPPGDKSISHRAVMFGALADGVSSYTHFLESEDCIHTAKAFQAMGVPIQIEKGKRVTITGVGMKGLKAPAGEIYVGNSGTTMRLLMGILAGQRFEATLSGDPSLTSRPMKRVTVPLKQMGAQIKGKDNGNFAPITIRGGKLKGIDYENKLGSAQVKSAILLAGLYAEGKTRVLEFIPSRDHTEKFLEATGAKFYKEDKWLTVEKTDHLKPFEAAIPGDISAAAFFIVGAAMKKGSEVLVKNVSLNPTRTGLISVLKRMGAKIEVTQTQTVPEPLGNIHVKGSGLKGTRIVREEIPSLIDELPILMTAMALAEGESLITGAEELRVKETDRILSMVTNLTAVGGNLKELPDGCVISGVETFHGGTVQSFGDHRTAMSLAIATLAMKEDQELEIRDTECIATSFPTFFDELERLKNG